MQHLNCRILISTLVIGAVLSLQATGQIKNARKEIALYNYSKAVTLLKNALNKTNEKTKQEATQLLADCYRIQNDMQNEKEWYAKVVAFGSTAPLNYYYYAQALRFCGEYREARRIFLKYDSIAPKDQRGRKFADYCDSAMTSWREKTPLFQFKNAKFLNSTQSDFGAVLYDTGIMFASDRIISGQEGKTYGWTGNNYLRLYCSEPTVGGDLSSGFPPPGLGPDELNQGWHDGPVSFNKGYTEIFINRTILYHDKGKKEPGNFRTHLLKIYTATRKGEKWSKPEPFFLNSDNYSVGHPALSPDGQTLFFVSDMPGGFGGTDLYLCRMEGGKWGKPVNLGAIVNTFGNEMFPYMAENGDLYFASDGLPGFGGLDLFVTRKINGAWSNPENLGIPLNSSCDDFALILARDGVSGLFSSNRPGGEGSDDIYSFRKIWVTPKVIPATEKIVSFVSGYVKDKTTKDPIPASTVFLAEEGTGRALIIKTNDKGYFKTPVKKGKSYTVKAIQTGYIEDCFLFGFDTLSRQNDLSLPRDLLLDKLEVNKTFRLEIIYYDFDKWNIRKDAEPSLDKLVTLMRENPVTIELGSHTDCRGSITYNQVLSQKRAESAVRYIIRNGIGFNRIIAKGYGKSQLLNKCNCAKGVVCTEAEHQLNRRTEFRILSWAEDRPDNHLYPNFKDGDRIEIKDLPADFFDNCSK